MTRPILATIHSAALSHNYRLAKICAPHSLAFAVIKANGYGHGLLPVARALASADGFALLEIEQAVRLREEGFAQPILLLEGVFSPDELPVSADFGLHVAVHSPEQVQWLEQAALSRPLTVCLKLNTGMNRLGFVVEEAREWAQRLQACPNVAGVVLMAHFATADEPDKGIDWQYRRFCDAVTGLELPVCLANSAAIIDYPATHGDWVRPGIMLYGSSPFADRSASELGLQPAMTLSSRIIGEQQLAVGASVGYGMTFCSDRPMRIGTVACGYADGYPRHAPTGTPVVVCGQRTRLLGRVSMDMLAVDLTNIPTAAVGSPVELWGSQLPIDEVAAAAGTISYELMCAVASRVPVVVD
ncbi:alanine racemase [Formivibrio citricus]|uniref:Alanine racemase n=1 Tax=Formivibrio citricus TaxID=83765 RepID=A0A1I5BXB1_9NEIS|nr:alanine racemase [Formivibrio citricus]SFN79386.1 alanine racemase [Formivibrio citricus]